MTRIVECEDLARLIPSGSKLAVPTDYSGVPMALVKTLIRVGRDNLHVVCVPAAGVHVDMLIGAGLVATLETAAVTLGEAGGAPRFQKALAEGSIRMLDATCPALHAGLIAAQKGIPFLPLRGILGTDVLANRPDWRVIQNPFAESDDPIVAIPAITPEFAIFHAPLADKFGNICIGRRRELATMAYAARHTLVTVERIQEESLLKTELSAAGVLPALYVDAVAVAPRGAAPYGLWGEYPTQSAEIARYAKMARSDDGFRSYLDEVLAAKEPA